MNQNKQEGQQASQNKTQKAPWNGSINANNPQAVPEKQVEEPKFDEEMDDETKSP